MTGADGDEAWEAVDVEVSVCTRVVETEASGEEQGLMLGRGLTVSVEI